MAHPTYSPSEIASLREDSEDHPVTRTKYFSISETSALASMSRLAAEQYTEMAAGLDHVAQTGGNSFMTPDAAAWGAENLRASAKQAREFLNVFATADDFEVNYEDE